MRSAPFGVVAAAAIVGVISGCSASESPPPNAPTSTAPHAETSSPSSSPMGGNVDKEQAGKIATDKYGGEVINIESDQAKGKPAWEIEIKNSTQGRIEVDVSQSTGKIVEIEHD